METEVERALLVEIQQHTVMGHLKDMEEIIKKLRSLDKQRILNEVLEDLKDVWVGSTINCNVLRAFILKVRKEAQK